MALPSPESVESQINARTIGDSHESTEAPQDNQTDSVPDKGKNEEEILNLDGVMKFKFGGREWSPDQLQKAVMLQQDYTKKTQQVSEEKKYWSNLEHDLEKVKGNRQLASEFMKVYPKQFHQYLKLAGIEQMNSPQSESAQQQYAQLDPEIVRDFENIREYVKDSQVKAQEAQLDAKFATLSKKYPDAIEDVVLARAQALLDKGEQVTDKTWDVLFKQSQDLVEQRFQARQKGVLQNQRNANNSAKGPSSGGGVPTGAPKRESFAQATDRAIRELSTRS